LFDNPRELTIALCYFANGALPKTKMEPSSPADGDDTVPLATLIVFAPKEKRKKKRQEKDVRVGHHLSYPYHFR